MIREITSATNPQVKQLRALATSKKARQETDTFIIEGWRGISTLLEHESPLYELEKIVISNGWKKRPLSDSIEVIELPEHVFDKISDVRNAQGILAVVRKNCTDNELPSKGRFLLLDNLRDPGNLGTLIRSAVGAGFDGIFLLGNCVEPYNPKVIRSSMGTFAFCRMWNVNEEQLSLCLAKGFSLCVTTGVGGENLYESEFGNKTLLVIGSEAHGVSEKLFAKADKKITIPLMAECESLNAGIAGSICMFHIMNCKKHV